MPQLRLFKPHLAAAQRAVRKIERARGLVPPALSIYEQEYPSWARGSGATPVEESGEHVPPWRYRLELTGSQGVVEFLTMELRLSAS
jgi:hypothetical protein